MAPKRNAKAKAPAVAVEEVKTKSRKRGGKVINEDPEENPKGVESAENGDGDHNLPDVIQPVPKKGRKTKKNEKIVEEVEENPTDVQLIVEPAKLVKGKRGRKQVTPVDEKANGEALENNIVESNSEKEQLVSKAGRKRGKREDNLAEQIDKGQENIEVAEKIEKAVPTKKKRELSKRGKKN